MQGHLRKAGHSDVRPSHFAVFRHMRPEGLRLTELVERAQMTKQSVGELVTYLEDRGHLLRQTDPGDGRVRIITLTTRGKASRDAGPAAFRQIEAAWGQGVGTARVAELRARLSDIAQLTPAQPPPAVATLAHPRRGSG